LNANALAEALEEEYFDEEDFLSPNGKSTGPCSSLAEETKRKKKGLEAYEITMNADLQYKEYSKSELLKELSVSPRDLHTIYETTSHS
jgi:hypothetical protein